MNYNKIWVLDIVKKLFFTHLFFLLCMSVFRAVFFVYYSELNSFSGFGFDIAKMLFLGFRIDLTVIGYIQILPTLGLIALYYLNVNKFFKFFQQFLIYYLFVLFTIAVLLMCADFGFYSYFKDHINVLFFGLFDDDTAALLETFWKNYNVTAILFAFAVFLVFIFLIIRQIFNKKDEKVTKFSYLMKFPALFFFALILLNFLIIRGTFAMYPLGVMIPNISANEYINKMTQNGVRAFVDAYDLRTKFKNSRVDYIKLTGFENNIAKAFEIHKGAAIDRENLLNNITYTTHKFDDKDYNIVVIMVESFGMPILKYQSAEFDILGNLKKHFDEDILFTNIISEGDGTIASLEALLLNIPYRPNSFPFSQSNYAQTAFSYSPAFLYNQKGYNTSFIYGGETTWRDIGKFAKFQNYKEVDSKQNIFSYVKNFAKKPKREYFHPWGIFDEYMYDYILHKLEISKGKEMILALSTNNHPPYVLPKDYKSKILSYSDDLKAHITGDFELAKKRFKSYGYALDSLGSFLDKFKQSKFKDNTIIAITADNNTIEGIMKYDKNPIFTAKNIPIYFYLPPNLRQNLQIDTSVAGSQKDIFPTLYNLTLKDTKYISIGADLFDANARHYGFNGSLIVNHANEVRKLASLGEVSDDEMINYYKATLAVTEYLIRRQKK